VAEHVVRQLVKLRVLERPNAVADHVERLFRHKGAESMLELWHAVEIDKERAANLDNGVVARQQANKVGEALGDGDVAQLAAVGDSREQHLMLIAAAQHLLDPAHQSGGVIVLLHLAIERIAHHRAVQQPGGADRVAAHHVHLGVRLKHGNRVQQAAQDGAVATVPAGMVAQNQ